MPWAGAFGSGRWPTGRRPLALDASIEQESIIEHEGVGARPLCPILATHPRTRPVRAADPGPTRIAAGLNIAIRIKALRHVDGRVCPGSPLTLRPGMRCEMADPSPDPRAHSDLVRGRPTGSRPRPPSIFSADVPNLPVASPDKARRAADPGPTRLAAASRSRVATSTCDASPAEWVPALRYAPAGNALRDDASIPRSADALRSLPRAPPDLFH